MKIKTLLIAHAFLFVGLAIIAFFTDGTGGGGDSLTHYFISESAWSTPSYFLDLWGKPVFTLLSSPFAQFGFLGIKLLNILVGVLSSFVTCLVAKELNKPYYWLILPIAFIAPAFYAYTFSGLTEPLFALFITAGIYAVIRKNFVLACILISFLPFIRSEGLLFIGVFGLYYLLNKKWKLLP